MLRKGSYIINDQEEKCQIFEVFILPNKYYLELFFLKQKLRKGANRIKIKRSTEMIC